MTELNLDNVALKIKEQEPDLYTYRIERWDELAHLGPCLKILHYWNGGSAHFLVLVYPNGHIYSHPSFPIRSADDRRYMRIILDVVEEHAVALTAWD